MIYCVRQDTELITVADYSDGWLGGRGLDFLPVTVANLFASLKNVSNYISKNIADSYLRTSSVIVKSTLCWICSFRRPCSLKDWSQIGS